MVSISLELRTHLDGFVLIFFGELLPCRVVMCFIICFGPHQRKRSHLECNSLNKRQQRMSEEVNPKAALKNIGQGRGQEMEAQLK